jgi:hypothetical protein
MLPPERNLRQGELAGLQNPWPPSFFFTSGLQKALTAKIAKKTAKIAKKTRSLQTSDFAFFAFYLCVFCG